MIPTTTLLDRSSGSIAASQRRAQRPSWSPWPTASRPATTAEELRFVHSLASQAEPDEAFARSDVTLLLNALRCGVTLPRLAILTPGMQPSRLLGAYVALDAAMRAATAAWRKIAETGDHASALASCGVEAAKLFPTQVVRLCAIAKQRPADLGPAIDRVAVEFSVQAAHVRRLEAAIDRLGDDDWGIELGALLYHPHAESVATRADFLPERVGLLSPTRVAALLGERATPPV